ncbi:MAG TPA: hypothetical protein PKD86_13230, partial [Gemmatales bacterium]|nr:hypothetical protein [Gemmatales bacterium]
MREADDQLAKLKLDRKGSRLEVDLSRAANMAFGGADIMMALAAISTLGTRAQGTFESVGATIGGADS